MAAGLGGALAAGWLLCRRDLRDRLIPHRLVGALLACLVLLRLAGGNPRAFHGGLGYDWLGPVLVLALVLVKLRFNPALGGGDIKLMGAGALAGGTWALVAMQAGGVLWALGWLAGLRLRRPRLGLAALGRVRIPLAPGLVLGLLLFFVPALAWPVEVPAGGDQPEPGLTQELLAGLEPGLGPASLDAAWRQKLAETRITALECPRQPVADLLRALGSRAGCTFLCDETVGGEAAWYFPAGSLLEVLEAFMVRHGLRCRLEGGVPVFSRLAWARLPGGRFALSAEGVKSGLVLKTACRLADCSVLGQDLPEKSMDLHGFAGGIDELLALLLPADGSLRIRGEGRVRQVEKVPAGELKSAGSEAARFRLERQGEAWQAEVEKAGLDRLIRELAGQAGFEYVFLQKPVQTVEDLHARGLDLEDLVDLLCTAAGMDYRRDAAGRYCFVEAGRKELFRKDFGFEQVRLGHLAVADAIQLLPAELASVATFRLDKVNNAVILYGSQRERSLVRPVLEALDQPSTGRDWHTFVLANLDVKEAVARLPGEFPAGEALVLEPRNAFMLRLTPMLKERLGAFLAALDQATPARCLQLRYLHPDEVLALLPAGFNKTDLSPGRNNTLYYSGPPGRFGELCRLVQAMDVPEPQIRYQVLVVEYHENESITLNAGGGLRPSGEATGPTGLLESLVIGLGDALGLSFDLVGGFGASFAASLDAKLARKRARIMTDTTIQGLSGQELKFQNTQTYRIAETERDPDTGEVRATGVTREITSGLFLGLKGTVSGDGMITMNLSATLSERGGDAADDSGTNPLSTAERVVNTRVRTRAGQPLVVGGLVKSHAARSTAGLPLLADVPLLGEVLGSNAPVREYSEVAIYILPFVEYGLGPQDLDRLDGEEFRRRFGPEVQP